MLLKIGKSDLLNGLARIVPIADKRTTLPILSHILLDVETDCLNLMATDLEIGLKLFHPLPSEDTGRIAIPSRKFFEIVKELPPGIIEIESTDAYRIRIQAGTSVFQLAGLDPLDYPAFGNYEGVSFTAIDSASLTWMIGKTLFAASNDESRFNLNGVFFEQNEALLCLVATDAHRLAYVENELGISVPRSLVVPKKGLNELKRILEDERGDIQIGFDDKNMYIKTETFAMIIRLIDGDYPDYRRVIPSNPVGRFSINASKLVQGLRRGSIFTTDNSKGINVVVSVDGMVLSAEHPKFGRFEEKLEVLYDGEPFDVIINVYYFMDALHAVDSEEVFLEYYREAGPIVIRPEPEDNYFNLVMPMKR